MSRKRASGQDIQHIRNTYKNVKSIEKTAKITGWSRATVSKYVQDLSSRHPSSKYAQNWVLKIDPETGKVRWRYPRPSIASEASGISPDTLNHCLKGRTKTAGGFIWKYKKEYEREMKKNEKGICCS